ncbi:MAG: hypothetical protein KDK33_20860, partial [Leptospiraceae bacterium]|nr:hypothetical protein [Leptospiraceae bacterium]
MLPYSVSPAAGPQILFCLDGRINPPDFPGSGKCEFIAGIPCKLLQFSSALLVIYYMRPGVRNFVFGFLIATGTSQCIKLDLSGTDFASLLAASSPSVYFFIDD